MSVPFSTAARFSAKTILKWTLRIIVGLAFIAAAAAKLSGAPQMIDLFNQIGLGQWFRYVTGLVELVGAILLLWPRRSAYGALLLALTMIGALFTHAAVIGGMWQPAAVLFALSTLLFWIDRRQVIEMGRDR